MRQFEVINVDRQTGEILEGQLVYMAAKRRNGFQQGGFIAMAQTPMEKLARSDLSGESLRVLLLVASRIDYENWINLSQGEMAEALSMKRQNFARALAALIEEGCILKGPSVGRHKTYRLNPAYAWKGSAKSHRDELNRRVKAAGLTVIEGAK